MKGVYVRFLFFSGGRRNIISIPVGINPLSCRTYYHEKFGLSAEVD